MRVKGQLVKHILYKAYYRTGGIMRIRELNWPILGIMVSIILFWALVGLVLYKNGILQEILSWLLMIFTGRKIF